MYVQTIPLIKLQNFRKKITHLRFARTLCNTRIENLLKAPA